ncbi:MAG: acyltransferase family protein [Lachnospiraceae bacterium]|nr:acyltransferase family protein [Lachnospiraceae bacterium]
MKNDMGRDAWPDYMKALGVIFIVFGHSYLPVVFLKLFYVPIFWIITGYYFKDKTFKEHIVSRAKRVYYPFVLTNLVYVIVRNINYFFGGTTFYYKRHDLIRIIIRIFLLDVPDKLASPMWFVTALLSAEMLYLLICKIFRKDLYIFGISIGLYIINFK